MKEKNIYLRTKEDLLNVLEIKGEACKKLAKELKLANRALNERHNKILSLKHEIRLLKTEIRRLKNNER